MKPQEQTFEHTESAKGYDIFEVIDFIKEKYGIDGYDFYGSREHFGKWADKKGYKDKDKDAQGNTRNSSQIWYAEYVNDPQGEAVCPPYKDVIEWFINEYLADQLINEMEMDQEEFKAMELPEHIKVFSDYVFKEFGKNVTLILTHEN